MPAAVTPCCTSYRSVTIPLRSSPLRTQAQHTLRRISHAAVCYALGYVQVLQGLRIEEHVAVASQQTAFGRGRLFKLRLQFFPEHLYPPEAGITFADVAHVFKTNFMLKLQVGLSAFGLFLGVGRGRL